LDKNKILLIFKIYEIFSSKYKILQSNNFKINLNGNINNDLKEYMKKCYKKYFSTDEEKIKSYLQNGKEIKKEKEKEKKTYLISQDEQPILFINDNLIKDNDSYFNKINEANEEFNINFMSDYKVIEIPNEMEQNNFDDTNNFYQKIIDESILLPRILKEAKKHFNKLLIEKCNKNFNILYYIYSIYKDENYSLLSEKINKFKDTFINLCYILKNAGLNFKNDKDIDEKLNKYSKKQSNFIEFIKKEINVEIKDKWYIKKSIQSDNNEKEGENYNQFEENYINHEFIEEEEEEFIINEDKKEN